MTLTVVAHPGSKKPRIERELDGTYHVYVHAKAHDGEANQAIIAAMAEVLDRPKSLLSIVRGTTSKRKTILVANG